MPIVFESIRAGDVVPTADLDALTDDEFEAAFRRLLAIEQAVAANKLACLDASRRRRSHVRHGFRDSAAWVAPLTGERTGAVRREVALAEQVATTPVVADALAGGRVSRAHAATLVAAGALPVDVQERLVERAAVLSVERLGQAVRKAQFDHGLVRPTRPHRWISWPTTTAGASTASSTQRATSSSTGPCPPSSSSTGWGPRCRSGSGGRWRWWPWPVTTSSTRAPVGIARVSTTSS
jgi:hypothetical protein